MSEKRKKGRKPPSLRTKRMKNFFFGFSFQKNLIVVVSALIIFLIIASGSIPKKYKLTPNTESPYDISAPRDIVNKLLTEKKAYETSLTISAIINRSSDVPLEILNDVDLFFDLLKRERTAAWEKPDTIPDTLDRLLEAQKDFKLNIPLTREQYDYILRTVPQEELSILERTLKELVKTLMAEEITAININQKTESMGHLIREKEMGQKTKDLAQIMLASFIRPNSEIDIGATEEKRLQAYENALENNKVVVKKNNRILSVGDLVTQDKILMLEELNMLDTGGIDYIHMLGIFIVVVLVFSVMMLFFRIFVHNLLLNRAHLLMAFLIMAVTILAGRLFYQFSPYYVPFAAGAMLIAIIINVRLAILVNFFIALFLAIMTGGDLSLVLMIISGGTVGALLVHKATQRSIISRAGIFVALSNILVTISYAILGKAQLNTLLINLSLAVVNGLVTVIITLGLLPFLESSFNLITPLKLMELSNPNQPVLKRLMIEAPGTYHHSLMVGNLAELAVERLGGNALLARVGAYYHDIGKLQRPDFFGENQISENPHNEMPPNLSASIIMSHTGDGLKIADRYKLPQAIKDIIVQHHGTSLVAFFYHKAASEGKGEVNEADFRYKGPRPTSTEAAVVMLADSVEAAVRSMAKRTEEDIEKLIRKIIKDRTEDGQLNLTDVTFRDLDTITSAFLAVFSGFFHAREKYPELNIRKFDVLE